MMYNIRSGAIRWQMQNYLIYPLCNGDSNVALSLSGAARGLAPEKKDNEKRGNE